MQTIREWRQKLRNGVYDGELSHLYCRPAEDVEDCRQRMERVADGFLSRFGRQEDAQAAFCSAAGRTEIGGNHTDHQRGRVLAGSVDLDAVACAAPSGTSVIRVYSEGFGETSIDTAELTPAEEEKNTTAALIRGIAARITELGYPVSGFDAFVTSDVPAGSGLSSSACFEVLVGVVMNHLFCADQLSMVQIAKIGQYAENVFFGKPSGLMDQMGCAIGGIVTIDFKDAKKPEYHAVDVDFSAAGYALCIVDSGADHADLTPAYSAIPAEMRAVAAVFGGEVLSEISEEEFFANLKTAREKTNDRAVLRAVHYFNDCRRVREQVSALEKGDFASFLELVNESGHSSFEYLQNICTFQDPADQPVAYTLAAAHQALAQICRNHGACRIHGGGFAGTIQAFVPQEHVRAFQAYMDGMLKDGACRVTHIRPVGGCVLFNAD